MPSLAAVDQRQDKSARKDANVLWCSRWVGIYITACMSPCWHLFTVVVPDCNVSTITPVTHCLAWHFRLRFGESLDPAEQEWIVWEVNQHLAAARGSMPTLAEMPPEDDPEVRSWQP